MYTKGGASFILPLQTELRRAGRTFTLNMSNWSPVVFKAPIIGFQLQVSNNKCLSDALALQLASALSSNEKLGAYALYNLRGTETHFVAYFSYSY